MQFMATISLSMACASQAGTITTDGQDLKIKSKGGLPISTADGQYKIKIGGRIQYDYDRTEVNGEASKDAFDVRRARLAVSGKMQDWGL